MNESLPASCASQPASSLAPAISIALRNAWSEERVEALIDHVAQRGQRRGCPAFTERLGGEHRAVAVGVVQRPDEPLLVRDVCWR